MEVNITQGKPSRINVGPKQGQWWVHVNGTVMLDATEVDGWTSGGLTLGIMSDADVEIQNNQAARIRFLCERLVAVGGPGEIATWIQYVAEHPFAERGQE